jgi:hypothetical protein
MYFECPSPRLRRSSGTLYTVLLFLKRVLTLLDDATSLRVASCQEGLSIFLKILL